MNKLELNIQRFADDNKVSILVENSKKGTGIEDTNKELDKLNTKTKQLDTSATNASKKIGVLGKGLKTAISAVAIKEAVSGVVRATKVSSDYVETLNLLDAAYQNNTEDVKKFADNIANTLNLDDKTILQSAAHFKTLTQSMGIANETGEKLAKLMTQMTLDVSSLYNLDFDNAQRALQYAMEGRGTTLKQQTGVSVLETSVQTTLNALGVDAYVEDMNDSEKALARVITMEYQLMASQGDLAQTIEAPANQFRVLGEQVAMVGRNIGNIFLPMMAAILPYVNAVLIVINKLLAALAKLVGFNPKKWDVDKSNVDTFEGLGSAVDGVGGSMGKAGKAADDLKNKLKGLRVFDKLNVINTHTESIAGGGAGGGGGGGINPSLLKAFNEMSNKYKDMLDGVETKATRIANAIMDWFKNLSNFNSEVNKTQLDSIKNSIKSIGESLNYIFGNEAVQASAKRFSDSIVNMLRTVVSSATTIGINLADGIIGGFSQFLDSKKDDIIKDLTRAFDIGTAFNNAISDLSKSLADISIVFTKDNFKGITESIFGILYETFTNATLLAAQFGTDIANALIKPIKDNTGEITKALDNTFKPIRTELETTEKAITNLFDSVWDAYDTTIKPMIDGIGTFLSDNLGKLLDAYNKYVAPVMDDVTKKISDLYDNYINPIVTDIVGIIADIVAIITELWKKHIQPMIDWITSTLLPIIMPIIKAIADALINAGSMILSTIKTILGVLKGVTDFLLGVFTGDWDKAFSGIVKIIDSFKTGFEDKIKIIKNVFNDIIENIKNIFNGFIEAFKNKFEDINKKISEAKQWFEDFKNSIEEKFKKIPDFFKEKFSDAVSKIKSVFNAIPSFFGDIFNKIKSKFTNIGTTIGDAVGGAFKAAVNGVLRTLENVLNSPIRAVNKMLNVINTLPGVNIGRLSTFSFPRLAQGGLPSVGQMFIANERGPELVGQIGGQSFVANQNQMLDIIDRKLSNAGGLQNATFVIQVGSEEVARTVLKDLNSMAKSNGKPITINGS